MSIRVGVFGVGNCAKSLIEGVALYSDTTLTNGLAFPVIGGYKPSDIKFVLAYDIDKRKVGKPLHESILALPNCAGELYNQVDDVCCGTVVRKGPVLDGVATHMRATNDKDCERFFIDDDQREESLAEVVTSLKSYKVDVALIYLPVGSQTAVEFYVRALLTAKVAFVNCMPVFIVSNQKWQDEIRRAGICAIGDDMRSQVGASILSQALHELFLNRGATIDFHCQTNEGGNTDFMNMLDQTRLASKKLSKENVITSQNDLRGIETKKDSVYAGPSTYIPFLRDNKVAHIRIEARGFGGVPIVLDARLSVQDSPNSAGVVIDAVRYLKTAVDNGVVGPLYGPSSATQKTPPKQMTMAEAYEECVKLASGSYADNHTKQVV